MSPISDCTLHAKSSARRFGGDPEAYLAIHKWFDEPKRDVGNFRHRAIRHHMLGVRDAVSIFGDFIDRGDGRMVAVALIGEQHLMEDCGFLPTVDDWMRHLAPEPWMANAARKLSRELVDA